jgi:hypothetical protein
MRKPIKVRTFSWGELWSQQIEIEMSIDAMRMLISSQEKSWENMRMKFDDYIQNDSDLNSLDKELQGSYYSQFYQREEQTIEELKRHQRNAACMSIFSFFEGRLKTICQKVEECHDFKIKMNDLAGRDYIQGYWNYLVSVHLV